jgi:DNA-binding response OmpR family regulator
MHQILIVDEEEHLLWALEKNLLPERDDIRVITASSGEKGLDLLRDENIDVLICDIKMPGRVDGFQLILRAKEVAPDARVVIMTAFGTNRIQNLAERIGITHYIEKPFNISDLRNVVLELLDAKEGFQGVLSDLELTDIIQMLCLAKRTALLHLKHKDHRGKIVFERGDVAHAEFDDVEGDAAVYRMLALRQGDIYMQSDFQNDKRTIHVGWQDLLLEGVRRADENRAEMGLDDSSVSEDSSDPNTSPFTGVFEDSGEISLGMPPRLVPDMDDQLGLEESSAGASFFTEEELSEIEAAGDNISGTANGFDRLDDPAVRNLIEKHNSKTPGLDEESEFIPAMGPGRPTDSSDFPAQRRDQTFSEPASAPKSEPTPMKGISAVASHVQPDVIAQEIPSTTTIQPGMTTRTSGAWSKPGAVPGLGAEESLGSIESNDPRGTGSGGATRESSPTMMLSASGILSTRSVLNEFAREFKEMHVTGLFSFDDGLALDFVENSPQYPADVLSAFFRDVAACADQTSSSLRGDGEFIELQVMLERDVVLMRRVAMTPYVHIAVLGQGVRLGIAIVMMRRYGDKLAKCFNA